MLLLSPGPGGGSSLPLGSMLKVKRCCLLTSASASAAAVPILGPFEETVVESEFGPAIISWDICTERLASMSTGPPSPPPPPPTAPAPAPAPAPLRR
ncbi:hypothetical protein MPTK1_7g10960 [Marchantia polymorpha subsp. ruderalis]|uniref:Uncharacterized protein n=2 Tax=Marchantia polymorpha TaxID=3197 RepID=A0AAF6BY97_MARPO|nr:hypothetical protein MARPO_0003s0110 [Marchantia polymorpha]BBN16981.1 hypothetical protein Mp_7g10960 [Marchantia polymorpha subsp. ruderalis]|eukprot:PTQ49218.1 hypothetical protein MARPO_0003s0110 [Marchantia polymorpha]